MSSQLKSDCWNRLVLSFAKNEGKLKGKIYYGTLLSEKAVNKLGFLFFKSVTYFFDETVEVYMEFSCVTRFSVLASRFLY